VLWGYKKIPSCYVFDCSDIYFTNKTKHFLHIRNNVLLHERESSSSLYVILMVSNDDILNRLCFRKIMLVPFLFNFLRCHLLCFESERECWCYCKTLLSQLMISYLSQPITIYLSLMYCINCI
jgi:hypothetical protein